MSRSGQFFVGSGDLGDDLLSRWGAAGLVTVVVVAVVVLGWGAVVRARSVVVETEVWRDADGTACRVHRRRRASVRAWLEGKSGLLRLLTLCCRVMNRRPFRQLMPGFFHALSA